MKVTIGISTLADTLLIPSSRMALMIGTITINTRKSNLLASDYFFL